MKKYLFCVFCIVSILVSVSISSCSKEQCTAENVLNETSLLADSGLCSALSGNFCSFLDEVVRSGEVDNDEVLHAIACEKVDEIKPLFAQTKSNSELDSFLNSNWELNESQYQAISLMSGIIITENFDFEASAQSCEEIISNLPEVDRAPVLLFYHTVKGVYEYIYPLQTKSAGPLGRKVCIDLSTGTVGLIWGQAIGGVIADATLGMAVGGVAGLVIGVAIGVAVTYLSNHVLVQGVVVDQSGRPMSGISVQVAGESISTLTEADGSFSFKVPDNSTIVITAKGYNPLAIDINSINGFSQFVLESAPGYQNGGECI